VTQNAVVDDGPVDERVGHSNGGVDDGQPKEEGEDRPVGLEAAQDPAERALGDLGAHHRGVPDERAHGTPRPPPMPPRRRSPPGRIIGSLLPLRGGHPSGPSHGSSAERPHQFWAEVGGSGKAAVPRRRRNPGTRRTPGGHWPRSRAEGRDGQSSLPSSDTISQKRAWRDAGDRRVTRRTRAFNAAIGGSDADALSAETDLPDQVQGRLAHHPSRSGDAERIAAHDLQEHQNMEDGKTSQNPGAARSSAWS